MNLFGAAEWVETAEAARVVAGWRCECVAWCGHDHGTADGRCVRFPAVDGAPEFEPRFAVCSVCFEAGHVRDLTDVELRDRFVDIDTALACVLDPVLFTGPDEAEGPEPAHERAAREAAAVDMCAECPVRALRAEYAHRTLPVVGIWAGRPASHYAITGPAEVSGIEPPARSERSTAA